GADVAAVEASLAQAQATLPPLQQKLLVQRDLLTALIGRFPSQEPAEKFELASLQLPQELPVSLPSNDADTLKAAYTAERAAFKSLEIARRQLQLGAISYLGLLTAQNTYQTALLALVQAQAARFADTAALFQALGGGWWKREDVAPAKTWDVQLIP